MALNIFDYHKMTIKHLCSENFTKVGEFKSTEFFLESIPELLENKQEIEQIILSNLYPNIKDPKHLLVKKFLNSYSNWTLPNFYVIPKLHKEYIDLPTTRPITGATNWITTPISIILDMLLQTHINTYPCILKDTKSFIDAIKTYNSNPLKSRVYLFSIDVVSLYPSIKLPLLYNILQGINPIYKDLTTFICSHNYVYYCESVYKQTSGIATGTNSAVPLANIYLANLLDNILLQNSDMHLVKRLIDDIFGLWTKSIEEFETFINSIKIEGLSFTYNISETEINYLDVTILKNPLDNTLQYKVFQKPISRFQYVSYYSFHPIHTKTGMIKGELLRYKRNSSSEIFFNETKDLFYNRLLKMGYPHQFLKKEFNKVTYWSIINKPPENQKNTTILPLILTYSNRSKLQHNLKQIILNYKDEFHDAFTFKIPRLILSYKIGPSLRSILTSSKLSNNHIQMIKDRDQKFS